MLVVHSVHIPNSSFVQSDVVFSFAWTAYIGLATMLTFWGAIPWQSDKAHPSACRYGTQTSQARREPFV
jgi:hypothetical protein